MLIIGVDAAHRSTGIAFLRANGDSSTTTIRHKRPIAEYPLAVAEAIRLMDPTELRTASAWIEFPPPRTGHRVYQPSVPVAAGMWMQALMQAGAVGNFVTVPSWRRFILGKANLTPADAKALAVSLAKNAGLEPQNHHEGEAYCIAQYGRLVLRGAIAHTEP